MSRFAEDSKDRVRQAADVLQVVGSRVDLQRKGVDSYFGNCPFHDERTPSFHVRPSTDTYYCFGCKAHGDVIAFVMHKRSKTYRQALEELERLLYSDDYHSQQSA